MAAPVAPPIPQEMFNFLSITADACGMRSQVRLVIEMLIGGLMANPQELGTILRWNARQGRISDVAQTFREMGQWVAEPPKSEPPVQTQVFTPSQSVPLLVEPTSLEVEEPEQVELQPETSPEESPPKESATQTPKAPKAVRPPKPPPTNGPPTAILLGDQILTLNAKAAWRDVCLQLAEACLKEGKALEPKWVRDSISDRPASEFKKLSDGSFLYLNLATAQIQVRARRIATILGKDVTLKFEDAPDVVFQGTV